MAGCDSEATSALSHRQPSPLPGNTSGLPQQTYSTPSGSHTTSQEFNKTVWPYNKAPLIPHPLQLSNNRPVAPVKQTPQRDDTADKPFYVQTATAMPFWLGSSLLFLRDNHSKLNFLVDTGASLSIIPFTSANIPLGQKLIGANGAQIPTWGFQTRTLAFGNQQFTHDFLLAKVATPILGLDFFKKFQLSIHPLQCKVIDKAHNPITTIFAAAAATAHPPPHQEVRKTTPPRSYAAVTKTPAAPTREVSQTPLLSHAADTLAAATPLQEVSNAIPEPVRQLLAKYPTIIRSETLTPAPSHGVEHHIDTGGHRPVFAKPRRLAPEKLKIAEAEFKKLEQAGIIRRSNSAWASPLHMVPKKDGSWQPCGDP